MKEVTLVITSCEKFDLLEETLDSFFEYNTYPIKKIIITEDSTEGKKLEKLISKYNNKNQNFKLIVNEAQLRQEVITRSYPNFGKGGATQFITKSEITLKRIVNLKTGEIINFK